MTRQSPIAARPLAVLLVACIPAAAGLAAYALHGTPHPVIHDEFSYLFAADTFVHGRLTNPAHPLWPHFESFDLISLPTLMSRKPPAQGLFLALGKLLAGHPAAGVLLGVVLAAAAICWMLLAFVEPPWALAVGLYAAAHSLIFAWSLSYWGGGVALFAGALTLGAWKRLQDEPGPLAGAMYGLGLSLLANSRPFEGLVFAVPLSAALAWSFLSGNPRGVKKALLPLAAVLAGCACFIAYYDYRGTGSVLASPYIAYEKAYNDVPPFIWQKRRPPMTYRTKEWDGYWNVFGHDLVKDQDTLAGYLRTVKLRWSALDAHWLTSLPSKFLLASAVLGAAPAELVATLVFFVLGATTLTRFTTGLYYSAPAGSLYFLLIALALKRLWGWRLRDRALGKALAAAVLLWFCIGAFFGYRDGLRAYAVAQKGAWSIARDEEAARIEAFGGKHLVLVRYGPGHSFHQEWVYNEADTNAARLLWARELTPEENRRLADFYPERSVWLVEVGAKRASAKLVRPAR
ncbi:MAG: hypothetical protein HY077_05640 [Elusimicrobia bacterium]|nr:hypothetical protein [Elusimicrobiota bacterium]